MKELSIEAKARRYNEAIERANELYDEHERDIALLIFPELRKSEDEIEKQGEKKPIDPDTLIQQRVDALADIVAEQKPDDKVEPIFNVCDKIQYLKGCGTIMTIEKIENGEYIFANNMGHATIKDGNKWYLVEQKPAEWSEEDEEMLAEIVKDLQVCKSRDISRAAKDAYQNEINWLKFIKDRV